MLSRKATTWSRASNDIAMYRPCAIGTRDVTSVTAAPTARLLNGPASDTQEDVARLRSAPRLIHTAPPGSGMPPSTRKNNGRMIESTGSVYFRTSSDRYPLWATLASPPR